MSIVELMVVVFDVFISHSGECRGKANGMN